VKTRFENASETGFSLGVWYTDGSGMICRTIGRMIMFSQVGFPTSNRHSRHDTAPMFVRYPRRRVRSVSSAAICATGLDQGYGASSAPLAAIRAMGRDLDHELGSAPSAAICAISRELRGDSQENETK
jgi:hypothetical protein